MAKIPAQYEPYLQHEQGDPSGIGVVLPAWCPTPELSDLQEVLQLDPRAGDFAMLPAEAGGDGLEPLPPALGFVWSFGEERMECSFAIHHLAEVDLIGGNPEQIPDSIWEQLDEDCPCLFLEAAFVGHPLEAFHEQLRILYQVAAEALLVNDLAACRYHTGAWLRATATQRVQPAPENLYWVHEFSTEDGGEFWLHSHGLLRCACPELEMLLVPGAQVDDYLELFHAVARAWIEAGPTRPEESLEAVQGVVLNWLPWEQVVAVQGDVLRVGGDSDRDPGHQAASAVLVPGGSQSCDLSALAPILADSPPALISAWETRRMSMQAKQGLKHFRRLLRSYRGQKGWQFHAKLGYGVAPEDPQEEGEEHLWFDVHGFEGGQLDASLLDKPLLVKGLQQGKRQLHALDQLSDWVIRSPHGDFDANSVADLLAALEAGAG